MEDILFLFEQYPIFEGFWTNIQLAFWASISAFTLGVILALFRISPVRSMSWLSAAFINLVRNTPLTVLVVMAVLVFWGQLQISMHSNFDTNFFILATIALSIYHAPFFAEAIRSGVNTVPPGQAEAARSIGLGFFPAARPTRRYYPDRQHSHCADQKYDRRCRRVRHGSFGCHAHHD